MAMHSIVEYTRKLANTFSKQGTIADVESTSTSSKAYAVGDHFYYEGVLYKVTSAIAQGDSIVTSGSGKNVEVTTVDDELNAVLGKKISSTVSGSSLAFTDSSISATSIIDGPYIADVLMGIDDVSVSGTTITYTLDNTDANGKTAYIWIRG